MGLKDDNHQLNVIEDILFGWAELVQQVNNELPGSREKSMVLTKLDEARLWLKDVKL